MVWLVGGLGPRGLALSAVFTVLVFAATLIAIETPITGGYFNLGESMVYTAAILGGPMVGMIAGGLGSSLADVYLGYQQYAPGTLVIKAFEGFIVGSLYRVLARYARISWFTPVLALVVGVGILVAGMVIYGGVYGGETILNLWGKTFSFKIPGIMWTILAVIVALVIIYAGRESGYTAAMVVGMLLGGLEMVAGYFLYEAIILGYGISAAAEIPVNIGQMLVGSVIAVFVVSSVVKAYGGAVEGAGWRE